MNMKRLLFGVALLALLAPVSQAETTRQGGPAFVVTGSGKLTTSGIPGCANIAQGCVMMRGTFRGHPMIGSFTAVFTASWTGGKCARAGGEVALTSKTGRNGLSLSESGRVCKVAGSNVLYHFTGTYSITTGTGAYETEGVGQGRASFDLLTGSAVRLAAVGSFKLTERPAP